MDPYLERRWLDVHSRLNTYTADALNDILPEDLAARVEERLAIGGPAGQDRDVQPDVRVFEEDDAQFSAASNESGGVAVAPFRLVADFERPTQKYVKIEDFNSGQVVTVIESISPTNKTGRGLRDYRRKRDELLAGGTNVVEVDLIRAGNWRRLLLPHVPAKEHVSAYRVVVRVPQEVEAAYLHPIGLRDRLPQIVIPLRRDDPKVTLDLQDLFDKVYVNGRYARPSTYARPPEPPLSGEDAAWAEALLKEAGHR